MLNTYLGCNNYFTWLTKWWIENDQRTNADIIQWVVDYPIHKLALKLEEYCYKHKPLLNASLYSKLLDATLKTIDFYQIAYILHYNVFGSDNDKPRRHHKK